MIIDLRPVFRALPRWCRDFMPYHWYSDEWWNLNNELADWIVPHLQKMRKHGSGYPGNFPSATDEEEAQSIARWYQILDDMIDGFTLLQGDDYFAADDFDEAHQKIQRAFDLLAKHWGSLWD